MKIRKWYLVVSALSLMVRSTGGMWCNIRRSELSKWEIFAG